MFLNCRLHQNCPSDTDRLWIGCRYVFYGYFEIHCLNMTFFILPVPIVFLPLWWGHIHLSKIHHTKGFVCSQVEIPMCQYFIRLDLDEIIFPVLVSVELYPVAVCAFYASILVSLRTLSAVRMLHAWWSQSALRFALLPLTFRSYQSNVCYMKQSAPWWLYELRILIVNNKTHSHYRLISRHMVKSDTGLSLSALVSVSQETLLFPLLGSYRHVILAFCLFMLLIFLVWIDICMSIKCSHYN